VATYPVSVIIPAHNESRTIGRLLDALAPDSSSDLDVVVVCNGCSDDTASVARSFAAVHVHEIAVPSKSVAQAEGDRRAKHPVRAYVDADVTIARQDLEHLAAALDEPGVLAVAPRRSLDTSGASWVVRSYYDVWEHLPQVSAGLFGRGVVVLSPEGRERLDAAPAVMSDDLLMSEMFAPQERRVIPDATVIVRVPRTLADLVRRRIRVATGTAEMDQLGLRTTGAKTSLRTLFRLARTSPRLGWKVGVFLAVTVVARAQAGRRVRSGDFQTWLRDESSRSPEA
jgi:glycosyltransferase involved in cell wall biosynthesis